MIRSVLLASCMLVISVQAEVYRWTDEDGRVHFGDRPPSASQSTEKVNIQVPTAPTEGMSFERRQRQQEMLENWNAERQERNEKRQAAREDKRKKDALCQQLLGEKREAERSTHVYSLDENGERVYYDEKKAEEYLKNIVKRYKETCQ